MSTSKCNHPPHAMCLNCLLTKAKQNPTQEAHPALACAHPRTMHCINCLPSNKKQDPDRHPTTAQYNNAESFESYLSKLQFNCSHSKPCPKCIPPLSRKTYFIDRSCQRHLPYPSGLCEKCMAPVISLAKQEYSHIHKVSLETAAIERLWETDHSALLIGQRQQGVAIVLDLVFLQDGSLNPLQIRALSRFVGLIGLEVVGIAYRADSKAVTCGELLQIASLQQQFLEIASQHPISRFMVIRVAEKSQGLNTECMTASDLAQALWKNGLFSSAFHEEGEFVVIEDSDKSNGFPTFLINGVEETILPVSLLTVEIPLSIDSECQNFKRSLMVVYPYCNLDARNLETLHHYISKAPVSPEMHYTNLQFLLHIWELCGRATVEKFINQIVFCQPTQYLTALLAKLEQEELEGLQEHDQKPQNKKWCC